MNLHLGSGLVCTCAFLLLAGCGGEQESKPGSETQAGQPAQSAPGTGTPGAAANTEMDAVLAKLTDAVRKYSVEKRTVPKDLNEVIAAGYVQGMPQAPAGKKFIINERRAVVLVDN